MRRRVPLIVSGLSFGLACAKAGTIPAPEAQTAGAELYRSHCAVCHGATGRGDGPSSVRLGVLPPDLRTLSRRNGGVYPLDDVARMIAGRVPVKGHGGPEMPIWADALLERQDAYDARSVRVKITAIAEYIRTLQTPPGRNEK
jgi:mono/diheme cytochrome c family protein